MDDYQTRMRFFEKERFRDSLDKGLMRLEEAHATELAGRESGRQPAVKRVAAIWDEPDPSRVVDWLYHRHFSDDEQQTLLASLTTVRAAADSLAPRHRSVADRTLYRLLHKIPLALSGTLAADCIRGRRKMCRAAGYRALRVNGTPPTLAALLWNRHLETGDQEPLELLACSADALAPQDALQIIARIDAKYYRMRLIESLIRINDPRVEILLRNYSVEFAWAAGRIADPDLLPRLREVAVANEHDPECIWSTTWAFSQMPIITDADVERMRHVVATLIDQRPNVLEYLQLPRTA